MVTSRVAWSVAPVLLAGCVRSTHDRYFAPPPAPRTIAFLDGHSFALTEDMVFGFGTSPFNVTVPAGFVTDYASIPKGLQGLIGPQGRYSRAAILHDYLYWTQSCTRKQSDNLLWIVMRQSGVSPAQRGTIYEGLRIGGWSGWSANKRERDLKKTRIMPLDNAFGLPLVRTRTWQEAREKLKGRWPDVDLKVDQAVCALGDRARVP